MEETIPDDLQEYNIEDIIGSGTFSTVRIGINKKTKEKVAIKILDKSKIKNENDYMKIHREINMLKILKHPNVIKIHKICENANYLYIIMEFCEKGELFDYIVKSQYLNEDEASFFYYQLINGLEYIHKNNIVHRDLKPENLLLTSNNTLKIIDFGLSNYFFPNNLLNTPCGSPCYVSPEMVNGEKYNGFKNDIWSTGIILYAMVSGYLPFEDINQIILFQKIFSCEITFQKYVEKLSRDLIKKIIVQDPEKRITIKQIKEHKFYLKGKEIFYKKHPELIKKKISIKIFSNNIKVPKDSTAKKEINHKICTTRRVKNADYRINNIRKFQTYNNNTVINSKVKNFNKNIKISQNNSKEKNENINNVSKILNPIYKKINKIEPTDSERSPRDRIKPSIRKTKTNNKSDYIPNKKLTQQTKINGELKKKLHLEFKEPNFKTINENTENISNVNKIKKRNITINLDKCVKSIRCKVKKKARRPIVIINSRNYSTENSNIINNSNNNIEKLTDKLNINNKNKNEKSNSVLLDNNTIFNFKNVMNSPKKVFQYKNIDYSKTQDVSSHIFNNNTILNNYHQSKNTIEENNIIINKNNNINFNDSKLYIYLNNNSIHQKNSPLQSSINPNSFIGNYPSSFENKNSILQEEDISKMSNINNYTSPNAKFDNNIFNPNYLYDDKLKHKRLISFEPYNLHYPKTVSNKNMNSFRNNFFNFCQTTNNVPNNYNNQMNFFTNFQKFNTNYNKMYQKNTNIRPYINNNIYNNVSDYGREIASYEMDQYNNQENLINENKNTENNYFNIYLEKNHVNTRTELDKNVRYLIDENLERQYNDNKSYINQIDIQNMRNNTQNENNPSFINNFNYYN